jgi:tellurite methyltransferase
VSAQCPQSGIARHSGRRVYQPRLVGDQFMMSKDLERLHKELLEYDVVGHSDGGYDEGYSRCSCFWGKSPGSLVKRFLSENVIPQGLSVLDLGSGEGKNAFAFAEAGAFVVAVDCSALALTNGQREFAHPQIEWVLSDAAAYLRECGSFDVIIMYGLLHCLPSIAAIASVLELAICKTGSDGHHIVAAFNDGPHDLSAHSGFAPTLASHNFYLAQYHGHRIVSESNELLWPAPGSEDTELGVLMELEVGHGETEVYPRVQA